MKSHKVSTSFTSRQAYKSGDLLVVKKLFLKILLRASTTLTIGVDAVPRLTHFTLILGLKGISFDVSNLKIVKNDVDLFRIDS